VTISPDPILRSLSTKLFIFAVTLQLQFDDYVNCEVNSMMETKILSYTMDRQAVARHANVRLYLIGE